jgi:hypothetical protein
MIDVEENFSNRKEGRLGNAFPCLSVGFWQHCGIVPRGLSERGDFRNAGRLGG